MRHDIWRFVGLLGLAALLGLTLNAVLLCMLIMAISIIVWQMVRLSHLLRWVRNPKKNPMPDMSGQFYQLHRDLNRKNISNRKRKKLLSGYLAQFRKAISALPDAIVLINDSGKIEWASPNATRILGIRWPEDAAVRLSDLIRFPEVEKLLHDYNPPEQGVVVHSRSPQDQVINFKCVRYTKALRMVIARDVSRLIKINQMHTDFVANVSHELKTPLTVLRGYLEILLDNHGVPDNLAKPIEQMAIQSERMQLIVSDLLYLAKLEDSHQPQFTEPVDVTHIINTIVEAVQPLIQEKRHKLELDIDYSVRLLGAPSELHSAFSNLITNAIHYTPENGLISVRWHGDESGAEFSVKDNGVGIPARHLDRLTQRFYRVDNDRSREKGGTGLGLAIVKHVLQRHRGELEIESREGLGSEFRCRFAKAQVFADNTSTIEGKVS